MTTIDRPFTGNGTITNILDRERIIATAGFNRWLVPPAALCIHLCILRLLGVLVAAIACDRLDRTEGMSGYLDLRRTLYDDMRLESREPRLDVHTVLCRSRRCRSAVGRMA